MSAAETAGPYRIGPRVGTSVWRATDTRSNRSVALKILTKQLPKDQAKRDAFVREMRVAGAIYHPFIVPIIEIIPVNDSLFLVMEFIEAQSISKRVNRTALARADFFKLAYQLVDAMKYIHAKGLTHGNVNADSVLVTPTGQVRLGGIDLMNLRAGGAAAAYHHRSADARSVAYMAPEQITGQNIGPSADIYSLGVVMYEMATGKLPYQADAAGDFARLIVEGQPASPKAVNPNIDNAVLSVLGKCLFKDQYKRIKDVKLLLEEIGKADPEAQKFATAMTSRSAPAASAGPQEKGGRQAILLLGDVANYAELAAKNPDAAARATSRMQQILGEAVYLFDGQVGDSFAKRMVAELPSIENALEAARKGEFDSSPEQQGADQIPIRMLLHAGSVMDKEGAIEGDAVTKAGQVLDQIPPLQLFLTEEFVKRARGAARVRDAGARGGMKVYTIASATEEAAQPTPARKAAQPKPKPQVEAIAPASEAREVAAPRPKSKKWIGLAAAAAGIVVIGAVAGLVVMRGSKKPEVQTATPTTQTVAAPVAVAEKKVTITPLAIEGTTDPAIVKRANAIRLGAMEILRSIRQLRVADAEGADVMAISGVIRRGTGGLELVPTAGGSAPVPVPDAASGIRSVLQWVSGNTQVDIPVSSSPQALNSFADAVTFIAANDGAKADNAVKAAVTADPQFLPAQLLAMEWFARRGKDAEALEAAKQVVALDPSNLDAARTVAHTTLRNGDVEPAFAAYNTILRTNNADIEALTNIARYSAAIGDNTRFKNALTRLNKVPANIIAVHPPDILVARGRMDAAIEPYYEIEAQVANNPWLSLKIGRLAVLRQSKDMAELELKKLEQSDPTYAYHVLKAYLAANEKARDEVENELRAAEAASTPGDDFWTSAAEIYAMLGDTPAVMTALTKASARKEPTHTYILTNPLFRYLLNDPQFEGLRNALTAQDDEIRAALAQVNV